MFYIVLFAFRYLIMYIFELPFNGQIVFNSILFLFIMKWLFYCAGGHLIVIAHYIIL